MNDVPHKLSARVVKASTVSSTSYKTHRILSGWQYGNFYRSMTNNSWVHPSQTQSIFRSSCWEEGPNSIKFLVFLGWFWKRNLTKFSALYQHVLHLVYGFFFPPPIWKTTWLIWFPLNLSPFIFPDSTFWRFLSVSRRDWHPTFSWIVPIACEFMYSP